MEFLWGMLVLVWVTVLILGMQAQIKTLKQTTEKILEAYEELRELHNANARYISKVEEENKELMKKVWALELEIEKLRK